MWALERRVELIGIGQTTFRKKAKRAGLEPGECYCVNELRSVPDLAIEIVHTSGGIDKLEVYRRLGVGEVWFWIAGELAVYCLVAGKYEPSLQSSVLAGIDLPQLVRFMTNGDTRQTTVVRRYQRAVRR